MDDIAKKIWLGVIEQFITHYVDDRVIPNDEGNGDALAYNLVMTARTGEPGNYYQYLPEQDKLLENLRRTHAGRRPPEVPPIIPEDSPR